MSKLNDISLGDLTLLSELPRYDSMRAWASKNRLTPISASRLIKRVETALGVSIVKRSNVGITITPEGQQIAKKAAQLVALAMDLNDVSAASSVAPFARTFVFASRGFLNAELAGVVADAFQAADNNYGVRFVDLSPEETIDAMKASFVDFSLNLEELTLGKTWQTKPIGQISWALYGRKQHPLSYGGSVADLAKYRLGHHAYWNGQSIVSNEGEMNKPLGVTHRGFGAQTAFSALSICSRTDQVVFVPRVAAKLWVDLGVVEELKISGVKPLSLPVRLSVESTKVPAPLFKNVTARLVTHLFNL